MDANPSPSGYDAKNKEMEVEVDDDEDSTAPALKGPASHQDASESIVKKGSNSKVEVVEDAGAPMTDAQIISRYEEITGISRRKKLDHDRQTAAATATLGNRGEVTALPANASQGQRSPRVPRGQRSSTHVNQREIRATTQPNLGQQSPAYPQAQDSQGRNQQPVQQSSSSPQARGSQGRNLQSVRVRSQRPQSTPPEVRTSPPPSESMSSSLKDSLYEYDEENSPPLLEATLVVDDPPAQSGGIPHGETRVVYMATQVSNWKRYAVVILVSLIIGAMAATIGIVTLKSPAPASQADAQESGPPCLSKPDTQEQVPPQFIPPQNDTNTPPAPTPNPTTNRPTPSLMDQLQSSALEVVPNEEIVPHNSGRNIAIHGNTAIIGAPFNDNKRGVAFVHVRDQNGEWRQKAKLEAPDGVAGDRFGHSVGIHGDTAIVGAPFIANKNKKGFALVFVREGNDGEWRYQAKLLAPDGADNDAFGAAVAIFDGTAIVGSRKDDDNGFESGSVHVFVHNGDDAWPHHSKLLAPDGATKDFFGYSLGIFGNNIIVGAPWDDDKGTDSGSVYLLVLINNIWTQQEKKVLPNGAPGDRFGYSVGLFENTAIIGSFDTRGSIGAAHLFVVSNNIWKYQAKLLAPYDDAAEHDRFGTSVGIFGDTAIVGHPKLGSVHLFIRNGDAWPRQAEILAPKSEEEFGASVGIYNGTVVVGSSIGEVYVFSGHSD